MDNASSLLQPRRRRWSASAVHARPSDAIARSLSSAAAKRGHTRRKRVLISGEWGCGKRDLLAATVRRLNDDTHARAGRILRIGGALHSIQSAADFWLDCLEALGNTAHVPRKGLGHSSQAAHYARAMRRHICDSYKQGAIAERALKEARTVLENLRSPAVIIAEGRCLDASDDRLMADIHNGLARCEPATLLANSTMPPGAEADNLFDLHIRLPELSMEDAHALAAEAGVDPSCVSLLHAATQNYRLFTIALREGAGPDGVFDVGEALVSAYDQCTPHFQRRFDQLPLTERRVFTAINRLGHARTTDIATQAHVKVRVASTMIGRLKRRGYVRSHGPKQRAQHTTASYSDRMWWDLRYHSGSGLRLLLKRHNRESYERMRETIGWQHEHESSYDRLAQEGDAPHALPAV